MQSFEDAPKTIKEMYTQFKAKNPVAALHLTGFVALTKREKESMTYYIQNQEEYDWAMRSERKYVFIGPFFD